jgi:hypothetical protein
MRRSFTNKTKLILAVIMLSISAARAMESATTLKTIDIKLTTVDSREMTKCIVDAMEDAENDDDIYELDESEARAFCESYLP